SRRPKIYALLTNEARELQAIVQRAEENPLFSDLVDETKLTLSDKGWKDHILYWVYENHGTWISNEYYLYVVAVGTFFRRSGCYISLYENRELNVNELFKQYCEAFEGKPVQTTYLAAIANYTFAGKPMDFGEFKIQKIGEQEFDGIMHNEIRKFFYPETLIDSHLLKDYWFVVSTDLMRYLSARDYMADGREGIDIKVSNYSTELESILKILSLYHWSSQEMPLPVEVEAVLVQILGDEEEKRRLRAETQKQKGLRVEGIYDDFVPFSIPFILRTDNYLLTPPPSYEGHLIKHDEFIERSPFDFEEPIELESESFKSFIDGVSEKLSVISSETPEWDFVERAIKYFLKGFLSQGLESLLWHIAVLEILLGQRNQIVENLTRRLAILLGDTNAKRLHLKNLVKVLYEVRSALVHGKGLSEEAQWTHLSIARNLARKTLVWFLNYLKYMKDEQRRSKTVELPSLKDIHLLLDLAYEGKLSIADLIKRLPDEFPCIKEWVQ
ncbi:MAG: hypothetical protein ACW963_09295, partial [Candidatus Sifarchaeia archaeon]